jgi:hypothetical protein
MNATENTQPIPTHEELVARGATVPELMAAASARAAAEPHLDANGVRLAVGDTVRYGRRTGIVRVLEGDLGHGRTVYLKVDYDFVVALASRVTKL